MFCPKLPEETPFVPQKRGHPPPYLISDPLEFVVIVASVIGMKEIKKNDLINLFSSASYVDFCLFPRFFGHVHLRQVNSKFELGRADVTKTGKIKIRLSAKVPPLHCALAGCFLIALHADSQDLYYFP